MSEQLITGLFTLVAALGAVAVTQWFNGRRERSQREEREKQRREDYEEWYNRTLYEKRLKAVQEAYAWLMKLNIAIANADPSDWNSPGTEDLRKVARDAREWYDASHMYLYDGLPGSSNFVGLLNTAHLYGRRDLGSSSDIWKLHNDVAKEIGERARQLFEFGAR